MKLEIKLNSLLLDPSEVVSTVTSLLSEHRDVLVVAGQPLDDDSERVVVDPEYVFGTVDSITKETVIVDALCGTTQLALDGVIVDNGELYLTPRCIIEENGDITHFIAFDLHFGNPNNRKGDIKNEE